MMMRTFLGHPYRHLEQHLSTGNHLFSVSGVTRTSDYPTKCLFSCGQILAVWGQFCPNFESGIEMFANFSGLVK